MNTSVITQKLLILYNSKEYKLCGNYKKKLNYKEQYIKFNLDKCDLLNNTNKSFMEIDEELCTIKHPHPKYLRTNNMCQEDFVETMYDHFCRYILNYTDEQIMVRYKDYEQTKERMFYRLHLYVNGWSFKAIEKYINNKYKYEEIEENSLEDLDNEEFLKIHYPNLMFINNIKKNIKMIVNKKGRPRLPNTIKEYIKQKNKEKMKKIMHEKYSFINEVKNKLFTQEEINYTKKILENNIENSNIHKEIINKLEYLSSR